MARFNGDIVIPVMGPTKSGKSSFLNQLLGSTEFKVSNRLASCTADVRAHPVPQIPWEYRHLLQGRRIVLVDTPGFDDTHMGDEEILVLLSEWLVNSYTMGMRIGGVLYLHDITREGSMGRGVTVFSKICGKDAMKWVAIVTTKWDRLGDPEGGGDRVKELCAGPWGELISGGAQVCHLQPASDVRRLSPEHKEPWEVVYQVLIQAEKARGAEERILQIQREIAVDGLVLPYTNAGQELQMSINKLLKKANGLRRQARKDSKAGRETELLDIRQAKIQDIITQLDALNVPGLGTRAKRWFQRVGGF